MRDALQLEVSTVQAASIWGTRTALHRTAPHRVHVGSLYITVEVRSTFGVNSVLLRYGTLTSLTTGTVGAFTYYFINQTLQYNNV